MYVAIFKLFCVELCLKPGAQHTTQGFASSLHRLWPPVRPVQASEPICWRDTSSNNTLVRNEWLRERKTGYVPMIFKPLLFNAYCEKDSTDTLVQQPYGSDSLAYYLEMTATPDLGGYLQG